MYSKKTIGRIIQACLFVVGLSLAARIYEAHAQESPTPTADIPDVAVSVQTAPMVKDAGDQLLLGLAKQAGPVAAGIIAVLLIVTWANNKQLNNILAVFQGSADQRTKDLARMEAHADAQHLRLQAAIDEIRRGIDARLEGFEGRFRDVNTIVGGALDANNKNMLDVAGSLGKLVELSRIRNPGNTAPMPTQGAKDSSEKR